MKSALTLLACLAVAGCSMTPTQKKWATIGASVVVTGMIIAHQQDDGSPVLQGPATSSKHGPFHPCPSGNSRNCK